jgi:hypothetical protein
MVSFSRLNSFSAEEILYQAIGPKWPLVHRGGNAWGRRLVAPEHSGWRLDQILVEVEVPALLAPTSLRFSPVPVPRRLMTPTLKSVSPTKVRKVQPSGRKGLSAIPQIRPHLQLLTLSSVSQ